jgi:hypothetical protein
MEQDFYYENKQDLYDIEKLEVKKNSLDNLIVISIKFLFINFN